MRRAALLARVVVFVATASAIATGQDASREEYGSTPDRLVPHRDAGEPCRRFFREPPAFRGPGRDAPQPEGIASVKIGVLAPLTGEDVELGRRMLDGIDLAIEEANAAGGYADGAPFETLVRDENLTWGAAGNAAVELVTGDGAVALLGAFEDGASHVLTRVVLKIETPIVNTAGTDPTLTEHAIPWLVRMRPDDRQSCYALAKRIFETDRRERVVVFRANDRYARTGIGEFNDAARRLRHPVLLEERFETKDSAWSAQIERIRAARPDAIVLWGRAATAGRAMAALRAAGITQPVYGPERLAEDTFLAAAGDAAEGAVFTYPFDTRRTDPAWTEFVARHRARYGRDPDPAASYAYDGTRYLLRAIRDAGLNRPRIRDALYSAVPYRGVTGDVRFDTTRNNVTPSILGHVEHGRPVLE